MMYTTNVPLITEEYVRSGVFLDGSLIFLLFSNESYQVIDCDKA